MLRSLRPSRPCRLIHGAEFATSRAQCAKQKSAQPKRTALRIPAKDLLTPRQPLNIRTTKASGPCDDNAKAKPRFLEFLGVICKLWLTATGAWYLCTWIYHTEHQETVPITGRQRYKALPGVDEATASLVEKWRNQTSKEPELPPSPEAARLVHRVRTILDRIARVAGLEHVPWKLQLLPEDNPLGRISFSEKLLQAVPSDSQLAFAVAHEVGHLLGGHLQEEMRILHLFLALALPILPPILGGSVLAVLRRTSFKTFLLVPGAITALPVVAGTLYWQHGSRVREYDADQLGVILMAAAGYDPEEGPKLLQVIGDFEQQQVSDLRRLHPGATIIVRYDTHPPTSDRIIRLEKMIPFVRAAIDGSGSGNGLAVSPVPRQHIEGWKNFVRQRD